MLKKLFKLFFISFLLVVTACAPKPVVAPPSAYEEITLSLDEILEKASGDTVALKAITEIEIRKNNEHYDSISASVLVKMPDWVHVRMYKFGMLVKDFVVMGDMLYVLSGKGGPDLKKFGANAIVDAIDGAEVFDSTDPVTGGGVVCFAVVRDEGDSYAGNPARWPRDVAEGPVADDSDDMEAAQAP